MSSRARYLLIAVSVFSTGACSPGRMLPSADGITIRLTTQTSGARFGELLVASDSGVVILADDGLVVFAPYSDQTQLRPVERSPRVRVEGRPDPKELEILRYHSRYPRGLDAETLGRLLSALGQDVVSVWPPGVSGELRDDELRDCALRAAERYRDAAQASLDGYRAVGPDFPGMGRHWIHGATLLNDRLDPDRPLVLCYATVDGRSTLVNVAYGRALMGESAPPVVDGLPPDAWHAHSGTVADEMLNPHGLHEGRHGNLADPARGRVVMVHVWTTPNADGPFAQHNWALPFLRAGLVPPAQPTEYASRFVGLGTEAGLAYQLQVIRILFRGASADEARSVVLNASARASVWIEDARQGGPPDPGELARLDTRWRDLGRSLSELTSDHRVRDTVVRLHGL